MTNPQTWVLPIDIKFTSNRQFADVNFFIYVVAYQPSSYIELMPRQHLMLKKL